MSWPKLVALLLTVLAATPLAAQRKLPSLTFAAHSIEFADANRTFSEAGQYTDTLSDNAIVNTLALILEDHPKLVIELAGHVALNEDTTLAFQRAEHVKSLLVETGISEDRIRVRGLGHRQPVISDQVIWSLSNKDEREAANQKNRRVEIHVIAVGNDEMDQ